MSNVNTNIRRVLSFGYEAFDYKYKSIETVTKPPKHNMKNLLSGMFDSTYHNNFWFKFSK